MVIGQSEGHVCQFQDPIGKTCLNRTDWHTIAACFLRVLNQNQTTLRVDICQPKASVSAGTGQDKTIGSACIFCRKRTEKKIKGQTSAMRRAWNAEMQVTSTTSEVGRWWDDVKMICLDQHTFFGFTDNHCRMSGQ